MQVFRKSKWLKKAIGIDKGRLLISKAETLLDEVVANITKYKTQNGSRYHAYNVRHRSFGWNEIQLNDDFLAGGECN